MNRRPEHLELPQGEHRLDVDEVVPDVKRASGHLREQRPERHDPERMPRKPWSRAEHRLVIYGPAYFIATVNFARACIALLLLFAPFVRGFADESIGIVLGGGGAFGAWQIGALESLYAHWKRTQGGDPPVRIVVGTSTGALIAPFAFQGSGGIAEAARWYTGVKQSEILAARPTLLLPFPFFAMMSDSFFTAGYKRKKLLHGMLARRLDEAALQRIASEWPRRRIGAAAVDFVTGTPRLFTNAPGEAAHLRMGVFASAMVPLGMPPVPDEGGRALLFDGGTCENIPIRELFHLAARKPAIALTRIVVITPLADFPGNDHHPVQARPFPLKPKFRDVNERAVQLYSESSASRDIALLRSALALRRAGVADAEIIRATGIGLPRLTPRLTVLRPAGRLGWRSLEFRSADMQAMYERGRAEAAKQLALP
jgi:predicted acylesterase/phospholipase RssA